MSSKQSLCDYVLLHGYQTKLKTMKKKYFVLFRKTIGFCSRLEYFDNENHFRTGSCPKRTIKLKNCSNINRRLDTKHDYVIALVTKDYELGIVMESALEMIKWLEALTLLQRNEDHLSAKTPIYFENIWKVLIDRNRLAEIMCLYGNYHVCLTNNCLTFIKFGTQKHKEEPHMEENVEILVTTIKSCGDARSFICIEVGRQSRNGPGELRMETEDVLIAQNMHKMILSAMSKKMLSPINPERLIPPSDNGASEPTHLLQQHLAEEENNSDEPLHKAGLFRGTGRCDRFEFEIMKSYPHRHYSKSSLNAIPEENIQEMVSVEKSLDELPKIFSNMSKYGYSQIVDDNTDVNKINTMFSNDANQSSSKLLHNDEHYTLVRSNSNNVFEFKRPIEDLKLFATVCSENHELEFTAELPSNIYRPNLEWKTFDDPTLIKPLDLTSSVSDPFDHHSNKDIFSNKPNSKTSKVTPNSLGFKFKSLFSGLRSTTKKRSMGCNQDIDYNNVLSNKYEKGATNDLLCSQTTHNSTNRMSDFMEMDFSKHRITMPESSNGGKNEHEKPVLINNGQLKTQNELSNENINFHFIDYPSASPIHQGNEYLEMKPLSLIQKDFSKQINTQKELLNKSRHYNFMNYPSVSSNNQDNEYVEMKPISLIHDDLSDQTNNDKSSPHLK